MTELSRLGNELGTLSFLGVYVGGGGGCVLYHPPLNFSEAPHVVFLTVYK